MWCALWAGGDPRGGAGRGDRRGESFTAIGEWVADTDTQLLRDLGVGDRRPSESTIRRALGRLDADCLDALIGAWMRTRLGILAGRRVSTIDGKAVRGAPVAPHLVAALDHRLGAVLGQVQVARKSNEIPALRTLLTAFDLVGAVISADALHTQKDTGTYTCARGGHFVFTVKASQPNLYRRCKATPWMKIRANTALDRARGRRVRRTIKGAAAPEILDFPHAVQVAQIRRTPTTAGKKSVELVYIITSMSATERASARQDVGSGTTVAAPGAQQALDRTERVEVEVAGRVGVVPRPNLLGALVAKAATTTIPVDPGRGRHVSDFALLASLLRVADLRGEDLAPRDIRHLRAMIPRVSEEGVDVQGAERGIAMLNAAIRRSERH